MSEKASPDELILEKSELKVLLQQARVRPLPVAVGMTASEPKSGVMLLAKKSSPKQLLGQLRKDAEQAGLGLDKSSLRFGRAEVPEDSGGTVVLTVNKMGSQTLAKALVQVVKKAGYRQVIFKEALELENEDENLLLGDGGESGESTPRDDGPRSSGVDSEGTGTDVPGGDTAPQPSPAAVLQQRMALLARELEELTRRAGTDKALLAELEGARRDLKAALEKLSGDKLRFAVGLVRSAQDRMSKVRESTARLPPTRSRKRPAQVSELIASRLISEQSLHRLADTGKVNDRLANQVTWKDHASLKEVFAPIQKIDEVLAVRLGQISPSQVDLLAVGISSQIEAFRKASQEKAKKIEEKISRRTQENEEDDIERAWREDKKDFLQSLMEGDEPVLQIEEDDDAEIIEIEGRPFSGKVKFDGFHQLTVAYKKELLEWFLALSPLERGLAIDDLEVEETVESITSTLRNRGGLDVSQWEDERQKALSQLQTMLDEAMESLENAADGEEKRLVEQHIERVQHASRKLSQLNPDVRLRSIENAQMQGSRLESLTGQVEKAMQQFSPEFLRGAIQEMLSDPDYKTVKDVLSLGQAITLKSCGVPFSDVDVGGISTLPPNPKESKIGWQGGGVNLVSLLVFGEGEQKQEFVLKPIQPAVKGSVHGSTQVTPDHLAASRNIACTELASLFGTNTMVESRVVVHDNDVGLLMERARGQDCTKLVLDIQSGKRGALSPKQQEQLMEKLNEMEWLDLLTGQGDRNKANYLVDVDQDPVVVKGYDNDCCLGTQPTGLKHQGPKVKFNNSPGLPSLIDQRLYDKLMKMNFSVDVLPKLSGRVGDTEIQAAEKRLDAMKIHATELMQAGCVVSDWATWTKKAPGKDGLIVEMNAAQYLVAVADPVQDIGSLFSRDFAALVQ